ncbi:MAG: hypothetical protein ACRYFK_09370 [Janthinobacterium lividum]
MELDDLRRQWQQAPAPPATTPTQLAGLLGRATGNLVDRMRRNTWYEIIASPFAVALPVLLFTDAGFRALYLAMMLPLLAVMGYYYYAPQLRLLRQMGETDASLHQHLQVLCQGLRHLLAFYYRLTYWTGGPMLVLSLGYITMKELRLTTGPPRWQALGLVISLSLLLGAWCQWGLLRFTRQYLQRLYGRHLDRLEGQLRELSEGEPAA